MDHAAQYLLVENVSDAVSRSMLALEEVLSAYTKPSVLFKPKISRDGNMCCALYGENLQEGIAGFGISAAKAMQDFDNNWEKAI
jgi:hypothetical protein